MMSPGDERGEYPGGEDVPLRIKSITNYYTTEVIFEPPVRLHEVQELVHANKGNAEIISMFNGGGVLGVSMKQRTKVPSAVDQQIRELLDIRNSEV